MENAADALKIAFAVFVFVIAISMTFMSISQAKATADAVLSMNDKTNYYSYYDGSTNIVTKDRIITTLYRYYKESFWITIKDGNNIIADFNSEKDDGTPWSGNQKDIEKTIDWFIAGLPSGATINGQELCMDNSINRGEKDLSGKYNIGKKSLNSIPLSNKVIYETFDEYEYSGKYKIDAATNEKIIIVPGYTKVHITYEIKNL